MPVLKHSYNNINLSSEKFIFKETLTVYPSFSRVVFIKPVVISQKEDQKEGQSEIKFVYAQLRLIKTTFFKHSFFIISNFSKLLIYKKCSGINELKVPNLFWFNFIDCLDAKINMRLWTLKWKRKYIFCHYEYTLTCMTIGEAISWFCAGFSLIYELDIFRCERPYWFSCSKTIPSNNFKSKCGIVIHIFELFFTSNIMSRFVKSLYKF